eukprot:351933-Chlamydomonas_euryale.AAC.2
MAHAALGSSSRCRLHDHHHREIALRQRVFLADMRLLPKAGTEMGSSVCSRAFGNGLAHPACAPSQGQSLDYQSAHVRSKCVLHVLILYTVATSTARKMLLPAQLGKRLPPAQLGKHCRLRPKMCAVLDMPLLMLKSKQYARLRTPLSASSAGFIAWPLIPGGLWVQADRGLSSVWGAIYPLAGCGCKLTGG